MGISIQEYRQRIGCFKVRGYKRNTFTKQMTFSNDFGNALLVIIRLSCLIALVAAVIPSSLLVLDLTQVGDVEKNPGPAQDFKFHLISDDDFERFAVTVLGYIYNIKTLSTFSKGPDGGRDAAARGVNIDLGGGNILRNQNLVVQVKHTGDELKKIDKNVFGKEKKKVEKLVQNGELDTYIMLTNYKVSAGQEQDLVKSFKDPNVGAKNVIIVGKETLSQWLDDTPKLQRKVIRYYPRCHLSDLTDCPKAVQSIQLLDRYKEDLKKIIDVEAFTKAKEIVESEKGLVFITGIPGSGKTTVAKQLVVQLFDKYDSFTYYDITYPNDFDKYWIPAEKYIFFMNKMDSNNMNEWSKLEKKLKIAIEGGSKFVFAGQSSVFNKEVLDRSGLSEFYKYLCNATIDLSDQQFNLSKDKKKEMLKQHVEMGDNDSSTKEALLKDDMLSHAAEINCPCFPLVASLLGSRCNLEQFKTLAPNKEFLDQFFKWVQSTTVASDSSSESCESPTPKRAQLECEPGSTVDNGNNITALREILSKKYMKWGSRIQPLPWVDEVQFKLDKIYTKLHFISRKNNGWQKTHKTVELSDIFDDHENKKDKPRTILIEGSPGMGKTTLSLKLAYDWVMGRMPSKFPPVELVLLIKCRDMKGDILEAINEQLFATEDDSSKEKLRKFIKEQPEKILLVVDGLDEIPKAATEHVMNLLKEKCLTKCYLVATSRQEKGLEVRKYFDTLLEIEGYSKSDIREYITRYFQDNDPSLGKRLIENLETNINLQTLATNPLNTVLLCVVFEDYDGELPSTVTELYDNIVYCITKRYCENNGLKPGIDTFSSEIAFLLETLGKLAYNGLLKGTLSFRESDLNKEVIDCTKMGLLYKENSTKKIKQDHTYWFLHKTFQEYLSAFYLIQKFKRQELTVKEMIEQLKDTGIFWQVLNFVSDMLQKKAAVHHKDFVKEMGNVLSQGMELDDEIICRLCEFLHENSVDKDMAGIIHQFLPDVLHVHGFTYREYDIWILFRILNILCTKDGVNKEIYLNDLCFVMIAIDISELRLICEALTEKLKVRKLHFGFHVYVVDKKRKERHYGCGFTAEAAKTLARALSQNCNLEQLYFTGILLKDVAPITAALTPHTSSTGPSALHTLVLQDIECNEQSAFAVAEMLNTNNTLKTLDMGWNYLGSKGVTSIAKALKSNRTLNHLVLMSTGCDNVAAAALADMLRSNTTLTKLFISNCDEVCEFWNIYNKVGDDGVVALADALRVNNSLKELHLCENDITNEGFKCLTEALLENTALERLCIDYQDDDLMTLDQDRRLKVQNVRPCCYCINPTF